MSCRIMRMMIFFDLPMLTNREMTEYRRFRKFLIRNGFIMMQESVYSRLVLNGSSYDVLCELVGKHLPNSGLVQMLKVTEKQYSNIVYLRGTTKSNIINTKDKVVVL